MALSNAPLLLSRNGLQRILFMHVTDTRRALPSVSASRKCTCLLTRLDRMSSTKALRRGAAFKVWMVNRMNKGGNGFLQTGTRTLSHTGECRMPAHKHASTKRLCPC